MGRNTLQFRLFMATMAIALLVGLSAGYRNYRNRLVLESEDLESRVMFDLELRQLRLVHFFHAKRTDLSLLTNSPVIHDYIQGFGKLKSPNFQKVMDHFGNVKAYPDDELVKLYARTIDWAKTCINHFVFDNLLIVDPSGVVIFAVNRGPDFGSNLLSGPYASSPAGIAIKSLKESNGFYAGDIGRYAPSGGDVSVFIGIAVVDNGTNAGYMLVQVPSRRIQNEIGQKGSLNYSRLALNSGSVQLVFQGFDSTQRDDVLDKTIPINYFDSRGQTLRSSISRATNLNVNPAYSAGVGVIGGLSVMLAGLFLVKIYRRYSQSAISATNAMIVQSTWSSIIHNPQKIGSDFYSVLYRDPQIGEVFKRLPVHANLPQKLVSMMSMIVNNSDRLDIIEGEIIKLAAMHVQMGVKPAFIIPFIDCFVATVEKQYDGEFSPKLKQAWYEVLNEVGRIFVEVIEKEESKTQTSAGKEELSNENHPQ